MTHHRHTTRPRPSRRRRPSTVGAVIAIAGILLVGANPDLAVRVAVDVGAVIARPFQEWVRDQTRIGGDEQPTTSTTIGGGTGGLTAP